MTMTCSTCFHWKPPWDRFYESVPEGWKSCKREYRHEETQHGFWLSLVPIQLYDDTAWPHGELLTGPEFGCIHHEEMSEWEQQKRERIESRKAMLTT